MLKINQYLEELGHLDKMYNRNSRAQKQNYRRELFEKGWLKAKHTTDKPITTREEFNKHSGRI